MTAGHSSYDDLARDRRDSAEYREGYAEAQRAFRIGRAVRERRLALGLSQTELAARAGMTQPALSRLEAGGVIPTIPLLDRISGALDADLIACQTWIEGTFTGPFTHSPVGKLEPNGARVVWDLMNMFRFDDRGRLVEEIVRTDNRSFLRQLGAEAA